MKKNELFNLYSNSHLSKVKNTSAIYICIVSNEKKNFS